MNNAEVETGLTTDCAPEEVLPLVNPLKHELDDSYKAGQNSESGIFSNNDSRECSTWLEDIKGEVLDPNVFDPPINSTALSNVRISCNISSIELEGSLFGPNIQSGHGLFGEGNMILEAALISLIELLGEHRNSTRINRDTKGVSDGESITTPGQIREGLWWMRKKEFKQEASFNFDDNSDVKSEGDAPNIPKIAYPFALNTDFDFSWQQEVKMTHRS